MKPESEKGGSATAILRGKGEKTTAQTGRWKVSSYFPRENEDVPLVVELRDGGPGVMVRRWRA
jgi:hypothetical protein